MLLEIQNSIFKPKPLKQEGSPYSSFELTLRNAQLESFK